MAAGLINKANLNNLSKSSMDYIFFGKSMITMFRKKDSGHL